MATMKISRRLLLAALGALVLAAQAPADARSGFRLTDGMKDALIAADPVRGPGVDRQIFDGKPILVVFFASW